MRTRFESRLDSILNDSTYQNMPALDFFSSHEFKDNELEKLNKEELLQLISKASFVVAILLKNNGKLIKYAAELKEIAVESQNVKTKILENVHSIELAIEKSQKVKAARGRTEKDPRHQTLNQIVGIYSERVAQGYNFNISGRLTQFYEEMDKTFENVKYSSIKERIEKERKKNKPTN